MHLEIQNPGFRLLWLIVLPADTNVFIQSLPSSTVTYNRNNCPGQYPDILNISSEGDTTGSLGNLQHSATRTVKKCFLINPISLGLNTYNVQTKSDSRPLHPSLAAFPRTSPQSNLQEALPVHHSATAPRTLGTCDREYRHILCAYVHVYLSPTYKSCHICGRH